MITYENKTDWQYSAYSIGGDKPIGVRFDHFGIYRTVFGFGRDADEAIEDALNKFDDLDAKDNPNTSRV